MAILEANNKADLEGKDSQPLDEVRGPAPSRTKGLRRDREVSALPEAVGGLGLLHGTRANCCIGML